MKLDDKKPNRDDANRSFLKDFYSHAFKKSLPISIPVKSPSFLLGTGTTLSYSIQQEDINEFNYHYSIQQEAVNKFNYHLPPGGAPITLPLHKGIHVQGYLWELTTGFFNEFIWARISSDISSDYCLADIFSVLSLEVSGTRKIRKSDKSIISIKFERLFVTDSTGLFEHTIYEIL